MKTKYQSVDEADLPNNKWSYRSKVNFSALQMSHYKNVLHY